MRFETFGSDVRDDGKADAEHLEQTSSFRPPRSARPTLARKDLFALYTGYPLASNPPCHPPFHPRMDGDWFAFLYPTDPRPCAPS